MSCKWKNDKWFVSPWNYLPEVSAHFSFADKIKIHDVSLRDGEQQAGLVFSKDDKIRIAEMLAEAGVHRIEAGMPVVSKEDENAVREIVKRNLGVEIFAFARCMVDDVKKAADCGVTGIVVEIPSSDHLIKHAYRWELEKAIDLSIKATLCAKEHGLYTVFFPIDASRADMDWVLTLLERVATEGHMDALAVVDTFGVLSPHAIPFLIRRIKERINKPLETHFHDDFGLGVANTIMALASGAEVAHTTVTAIGERAGNTPYEDLVLTLLTMYGVDLGIKTEQMYKISKTVREIAGLSVQQNRGVVGDMIYKIESGIITGWFKNCGKEIPTEVFPLHWELVGQNPPEIVLGKNSGAPSIEMWLEKLGIELNQDKINEVIQRVKNLSLAKKGLLDEEDFRKIVAEV